MDPLFYLYFVLVSMKKRIVVVFDFDGTLIKGDTFIDFVRFSRGDYCFLKGLILNSFYLVAYKLGLYPNWKAKERLFYYYFKGLSFDTFQNLGRAYASEIKFNSSQLKVLKKHQSEGADIYVITASIEEWVIPYCETLNIRNVLGTKIEVKDGYLTGYFASKNCFGIEKVNRFLEVEPNRDTYFLYAYGDSRGDDEIIAFSDIGCKVK